MFSCLIIELGLLAVLTQQLLQYTQTISGVNNITDQTDTVEQKTRHLAACVQVCCMHTTRFGRVHTTRFDGIHTTRFGRVHTTRFDRVHTTGFGVCIQQDLMVCLRPDFVVRILPDLVA